MTDLPTSISAGRSRGDHIADHERLHRRHAGEVYSADYATLQDAFSVAIAKQRPLVIEPITHLLTEPIVLNQTVRLIVQAHGASIRAASNMDVLLDVAGGGYSVFDGLRLETATGVKVGDMLRVRKGNGTWAHGHSFYNTWISGDYLTGIRIGVPEDANGQCDDTLFIRTELGCHGDNGVGIYAGNGTHANNMLHTFYGLSCGGHKTHVLIDATTVHIDGGNFAYADLDFDINSPRFYAAHVRCEGSGQFIRSRGPSGFGAQATFVDCQWWGSSTIGERWIEWYQSGLLRLLDCSAVGVPMQPVIYAQPGAALNIIIDGLTCGAAVPCPHKSAFTVSAKTTITTRSYIELDTKGVVKAQVIA
jgi:hypothetical protein